LTKLEIVWDGAMAIETLRNTERNAPLHMRPEHVAGEFGAWLESRRDEMSAWEQAKAENALCELGRLIGSIKTRQMAKVGQIGPRQIEIVHED
jgi:hypothetical protein